MKKLFLLIIVCLGAIPGFAKHITGGEMYYTLTSQSGNNYTYHVVLKLYRDCNAPSDAAQLDPSAKIGIFNNSNNNLVWQQSIEKKPTVTLDLSSPSPCIQNPPDVCYQVGYYEFDVTLPGVPNGYTVVYQRCCRIGGINNLVGSDQVGATYTAEIPGTSILANGPANNSARFTGRDTVIICANNYFCYDFSASDPDSNDPALRDSLAYSFCGAFLGAGPNDPAPAPSGPPFIPVPYSRPYFGQSPLGPNVTLDPKTGMICGIAPSVGIYVVTVCVTEYRNGKPIATQRKDLQIKVGDCNVADASLKQEYLSCDGFTYTFTNEAPPSVLIKSYFWDFGDGFTSTQQYPTHTYADTGTYVFKLAINRGEQCSDSAISRIKVYPGFFPGFTSTGICVNKPSLFFDTTKTKYGLIDTWNWDFGDADSQNDISNLQNPSYTYTNTGTKNVRFIVTNSKGCRDTVYKTIDIIDKPVLTLPFSDTLICNGDTLQLHASGIGSFSWSPAANIINPSSADPFVHPTSTTRYTVQLNDNGCINNDTVQVRVVNFVTLKARGDTVICLSDSVQLSASGDGLRYVWSPAATIQDPNVAITNARPSGTTTYQVTASIGRCKATDDVIVTTVPYPGSNAGADTAVCFKTSAQLHASIKGSSFTWSPANSLDDPNSLNPIASPANTTSYVLTVLDNIGCPKPGRDTVLVTVYPKVNAFAGNDTSVVVNQPLLFNATGGESYSWSPRTSLSSDDIYNPIGVYNGSLDSITYRVIVVDENNCSDSAFVTVKIFKTNPQVFVPTAFTPNNDGKNDVFRPIAVGILNIEYFRVFNRWGQLVFSTTTNGKGWDGKIAGKEQASGTFVWVVKGVDYTGKSVFAKGTVTLIR